MKEYASLLLKVGVLEGAMIATKERIRAIPKQMARELQDEGQQLDAARYLYWFTDIPAEAIAEGLLGMDTNGWHVDVFLDRIGPTTIDVACDRCQRPMECRSRKKEQEIRRAASGGPKYSEGYRLLCAPCWDAVQREREEGK